MASPDKVAIKICENSDFKGMRNFASTNLTSYDIDDGPNFMKLRQGLYNNLEIDPSRYGLRLHVPDKCNEIVYRGLLDTYTHLDKNDRPIIFACVTPDTNGAPLTAIKGGAPLQQSRFSNTALPPGQQGTMSKPPQSLNSKRDASNMDLSQSGGFELQAEGLGVVERGEDTDNPQYIRIGTKVWGERQDQNDILLDLVVVGEVNQDHSSVKYLQVDTWTINDVQIGYCEYGDQVDIDKTDSFIPDPFFKDHLSHMVLKPKLLDIAAGQQKRNLGTFQPPAKKNKTAGLNKKNPKLVLPFDPPTKPIHAGSPFFNFPTTGEPPTSKRAVHAILFFRNQTGIKVDLDLPINQRVLLGYKDNYDKFRRYLYDDMTLPDGRRLEEALAGKLEVDWDVDVWVLPQIRGAIKMVNWTRTQNSTANDFLDAALEKKFERNIFIEVNIIENESTGSRLERKQQKKKEKKETKGKRGAMEKKEKKKQGEKEKEEENKEEENKEEEKRKEEKQEEEAEEGVGEVAKKEKGETNKKEKRASNSTATKSTKDVALSKSAGGETTTKEDKKGVASAKKATGGSGKKEIPKGKRGSKAVEEFLRMEDLLTDDEDENDE